MPSKTLNKTEQMYRVVFWKKCGLDDMETAVLEADVFAKSADEAERSAVFALHGNLRHPLFRVEYSSLSAKKLISDSEFDHSS